MRMYNRFFGGLLLCLAMLFMVCHGLNQVNMTRKDKTVTGYIADYGNAPWRSTINDKIQVVQTVDPKKTDTKGPPCHKFTGWDMKKGKIALLRGEGIQSKTATWGKDGKNETYKYNCLLSTMASHAQLAGAKALIIEVKDKEPYKALNDFIAGSALEIPTFLVKKSDSQNWEDNNWISLRLDAKTFREINYELWMSSHQPEAYDFLKRFKSYHKLFGSSVTIIPKYVLWYDFQSKIENYKKPHDSCVSNGRYCAPPPEDDGWSGRDVVMEELRQYCIFGAYKGKNPMKWYNYMLEYGNCMFKSGKSGQEKADCNKTAMDNADVDKSLVEKCIALSFNKADGDYDPGKTSNQYLEQMREEFARKKIGSWPSVAIHDNLYTNPLEDPESLFDAICQEFDEPPSICKNYWQPTTTATTSDYFWGIVLIILILGGAFALMVFLYKRMIKKELNQQMESQISSIVSQYYSMDKTGGRSED